MIVQACVVIHNMIVEVRKDDYMCNGVGSLRGMSIGDVSKTAWRDRDEESTRRDSVARSMRSTEDQYLLKNSLGQYISSLVEEERMI